MYSLSKINASILESSLQKLLYPLLQQEQWGRLISAAALGLLLTTVTWWIISELASPLRRYPGPFFARWTNIWRFVQIRSNEYHQRIQKLHEIHGPIVRIGPNILDLDYPELIKTIYGTDGKWVKTDFYHNNSAIVDGKITYHLFSETRKEEHANMKRPVVKYFSQSSVLAIEPLMDTLISDFIEHLDKRFTGPGAKPFDFAAWIAFYSWDMNGAASFSKRFGYMDHGSDYDHTIADADGALDYFAAIGQMPFLDFLLDKNPIKRIGPPNLGTLANISIQHVIERQQGKDSNFNPEVPDFLHYFINAKNTHPDLVNDGTVISYLLVLLIAGSDTTAVSIRAVVYYLLRHPRVYKQLQQEVDAAGFGKVASYLASRKLPYLEAVVREAMRIHPAACILLERYVPQEGLKLPSSGFVPAGTKVGINPYVAARNKSIWGGDVETFRPERWLRGHAPGPEDETEEAYQKRLRRFNATDLAFGAGSHICIGRNLANMEVYKIVATLMNRYDIELVDPTKEWNTTGSWFWRQKGIICNLKKRN